MKLLERVFKKHSPLKKIGFTALGIIAVFVFGIYGTQTVLGVVYQDKLLPGVVIGDRSFGTLTKDEARIKLQKTVDGIKEKGSTYCYDTNCITINTAFIALNDPDLRYDLYTIDTESVIDEAYAVGRKGSFGKRIADQWKLTKHDARVPITWNVDEAQIREYLQKSFSHHEQPAENASFTVTNRLGTHVITFHEPKSGVIIDYTKAMMDTYASLSRLEAPRVELSTFIDRPKVTEVDRDSVEQKVLALMKTASWSFTAEDGAWQISKNNIASALTLGIEDETTAVVFDKDAFQKLLDDPIHALTKQPRDARFEIKDGRVVEFQSSQDGVQVLVDETLASANAILQTATSTDIAFPIIVATVPSATPNSEVNDLGITERIGVGRSNFSGSPANRRHNIAIGSATLNGILIPPGEEFSLINTLGEIDGTNGYLEELVIKGNETKPEFGGGLCQVGTTMFRATLNTGLPVTERQNHSYRVRYYEPAGTDATIYGPHPDFRFINDTGHHILIQTHIEGDDLVYEFWGTSDGRMASQTEPAIYNITTPPPTKYIETLDLPVGQIKCTERAHNGADASFDYSVTYPDGTRKDKTFTSHYRAWQEVCLIGVEALSEPETPITDTQITEETQTIPDPYAESINSLN